MRIAVDDGVKLFVDVDGAEYVPDGPRMRRRPTLVLLHGGPGMDHSSFKLELGSLREIAQLVFIDHRGNGRSDDGPREKWNLAQWGDDVRTVCDVLGIENPVVMGQSFGGFVAQAYATRHPEHPAAVIFSSTSPRKSTERNLAMFEKLGGATARSTAEDFYRDPSPETLGPFVKECMSLYNTRSADPDGMRRSVLRVEVLFHFSRNGWPSFNFLPDLPRICCPTLVLGGEEDPTTPIQDQEDIAAAIRPDLVQFHRFPDCGHGAYRDCPDQAIPIIRNFVLSHWRDPAD
jgi:proline iminopeptidase